MQSPSAMFQLTYLMWTLLLLITSLWGGLTVPYHKSSTLRAKRGDDEAGGTHKSWQIISGLHLFDTTYLGRKEEGAGVLLADPQIPRGQWKIGRVVKVMPGLDGLIRTAEVKINGRTYVRPIVRLIVLPEVKDEDELTPAD